MQGLLAAAFALLLGTALSWGSAGAGVPLPRYCIIDRVGVGDNLGAAVGGSPGGFNVTVRDLNDAPLLGTDVTLDFSGCDVRVYTVQETGTTVDASTRTASRTAPTGTARFALRSGGFANANTVLVTASGVVIGHIAWRSTDIDAQDGRTGLGDVTYFSARYLGAAAAPECNFDRSPTNVPGLGDFTVLSAEYLSGASGAYAW